MGTEEQPPKASEESSGSGLAPHICGRPLPEPTPESAEGVAGPRPRRYQEPTRLVSQVVHIDSSNIVVCLDWHDTLDQALNPIGELPSHLVEKFRSLVRLAENRIEFHIVSYAGWSKIEGTKASAEYLIDSLNRQGLPFREVHFSRAPCGREGKSSIVSALQAHCLVDDRQDVLNENYLTGIKVIRSEGRWDRELSWISLIDDWLRQEGIESESILQRRRPTHPTVASPIETPGRRWHKSGDPTTSVRHPRIPR